MPRPAERTQLAARRDRAEVIVAVVAHDIPARTRRHRLAIRLAIYCAEDHRPGPRQTDDGTDVTSTDYMLRAGEVGPTGWWDAGSH
jgi:hypothetical protein